MTTINNLFCTPEQGRRLKELVPGLTSAVNWVANDPQATEWSLMFSDLFRPANFRLEYPALTLQELRDLVEFDLIPDSDWLFIFRQKVFSATAPELAAWVIERLEATP